MSVQPHSVLSDDMTTGAGNRLALAQRRALQEVTATTDRLIAEHHAMIEVASRLEAQTRRLERALESTATEIDDQETRAGLLESRLSRVNAQTEALTQEMTVLSVETRRARRQLARLSAETATLEEAVSNQEDTGAAARSSFQEMQGALVRIGYKLQIGGSSGRG